MTLKHTYMTLI
nr:unnamed protein product [Callosobruchus chinensis]